MKKMNPQQYKLSSRINLYETNDGDIAIVKNRKSRITMKDGYQILKQKNQIRKFDEGKKIVLLTTAPVCSKTEAFLSNNGINVVLCQL